MAEAEGGQSDNEKLARANEIAWLQVATLAEQCNDLTKAADAYHHVLRTNSKNVHALLQLASIGRMQERFEDAVEYLNRIMAIDGPTGEVYGAIGHCYLTLSQRAQDLDTTLDCLRKCYDAYHEASLHLGAFNDPNLWYGIGLLYERYASLMRAGTGQRECYQAAEESLRSVLQAAPGFEKRSEILYRCAPPPAHKLERPRRERRRSLLGRRGALLLPPQPTTRARAHHSRRPPAPPLPALPRRSLGQIYKVQNNPHQALECFQAICDAPPPPLTQADVWFLIGNVQETMEPPAPEFARQAYMHVLRLMQMNQETKVARVYRQLGWVCHKHSLEAAPLLGLLVRAPSPQLPLHSGTLTRLARPAAQLRCRTRQLASSPTRPPPRALLPAPPPHR